MPALAAPVVGWIAAPLVGVLGEGAAIAFATFLVNTTALTAASAGINAVSRAVSGKNKQGIQERQAGVLSLAIGEVPRQACVGVVCVGGSSTDIYR